MFGLGIIWGICMVSQDLFSYNLYFLLLNTEKVNCQNFINYYIIFLLATTLVTGLFYPLSGWLTDKIKNTKKFFLFTAVLQLVLFMTQYIIVIKFHYSIYLLVIIWLLIQILFVQNNNLFWKIAKNYACANNNELEIINTIGNMGDLTSDITESTILSILTIILLRYKNGIFVYIELYLFAVIFILNVIFVILSAALYYKTKQTPILIITTTPSHHTINDSINDTNETLLDKQNEEIREIKQVKQLHSHPDTDHHANSQTKIICWWLIENTKKFYHNKILFHIFWHCIILLIYSLFVQYPLSLRTINIIDVNNDNMNIFNLCGGKIINIIFLGSVTNIFYLIGSILYRCFIVKLRPYFFYKYWYVIGTIILFAISILLLFNINYILVLILISIATIIPYYLTYYDYYYFTERCESNNYPYALGLYGFVSTISTFIIQFFFLFPISTKMIVIISGIILMFSLIYTFYVIKIIRVSVL